MADAETEFISQQRRKKSKTCRVGFKLIFLFMAVILVSAATSVLTDLYLSSYHGNRAVYKEDGRLFKGNATDYENRNTARHMMETPKRFHQKRENDEEPDIYRYRALLVMDTDSISSNRLGWSAEAGHDRTFIGTGMSHVTENFSGTNYDCVEVGSSSFYQVNVQLTFDLSMTSVHQHNTIYFTVTEVTSDNNGTVKPRLLTKTMLYFPENKDRLAGMKESRQINRIFHFESKTKVCVTVSDIELLYRSKLDNYFVIFMI